jgi:hypothetical protein
MRRFVEPERMPWERRLAEKIRTITKLSEAPVKFVAGFTLVPKAPTDSADDREDPGTGPDDRPLEREEVEVVPLPHFG